ncbi:MAG: hypothetical protein S4CHLAM27_06920 [Chlamydiia bacterium]|nr:hypothetical protein [Chlamydiia bacterium]
MVVENVDVDFNNLELGWISIKKDIFTGKKVIQEKKFEEKPSPIVVVDKTHQINTVLEKAYETRTSEYIDMWGHVLIGSSFLLVCFFRLINSQFTRHHHLGFEAAA